MRWLTLNTWVPFRRHFLSRPALKGKRRPSKRLLEVEALEQRCVPANVAPHLSGVAFIDLNGNGRRDAGEGALQGVNVSLTGKTYHNVTGTDGAAGVKSTINVSTTTDANGRYSFLNVPNSDPAGTGYQISFGTPSGYLSGRTSSLRVKVTNGQSLNNVNLALRGLASNAISLRLFLSRGTTAASLSGRAGSGSAAATGPVLISGGTTLPNVSLLTTSADNVVDLSGYFTAPDITNSVVRLNTSAGALNLQLYDKQTPQTVANFLDYITNNSYNNTIFHRLDDSPLVLQGGGYTYTGSEGSATLPTVLLPGVTSNPTVKNEPAYLRGLSNTKGTIAMAKRTDPDSASNQFYFNLGDNSASLDPSSNSGGFTVFGKVKGSADQTVLNTLTSPQQNVDHTQASPFDNLPINKSANLDNFPTNTKLSDYEVINNAEIVNQNEKLTYSFTNSDTTGAVVTATLNNYHRLTLHPVGGGTATITVKATDQFGTEKVATFTVTVSGIATQFTVSAPTSEVKAGTFFTFTVTAKDSGGNTATAYTRKVTFTSTDTAFGVVLPSAYTFTAADKGVHTFTNAVKLQTTGTQKLTVTDTETSSITGTSNDITVI
jgi:cyclophilin family peptidyl-prolyl cis-trans isomerase